MAAISVTYTFVNSTTADAAQVNQNFTDIINGTSDGTKDFTINAITAAGTSTLNGNVVLGLSTAKDVTITGSLAASINIKTNNSFDIGSSTLGLASVYLGTAGAFTTRLVSGATASWTMTLPVTAGTNLQVLQTNGSGVTSWSTPQRENDARQNYSITTSVGSNNMTVALKYSDGNDATGSNVINIMFRSSTAATGTTTLRTVSAALSMSVLSGATLGHANAKSEFIYVYAIDNAGTVELAVSGTRCFDEGSIQTTTGISGSSTSKTTLYSTTSRTGVGIRYLGRLISNQTTAGTYTATATESAPTPSDRHLSQISEVWVYTANGYGSTNNAIRRFTTTSVNTGSAVTYADSAGNGASFTINEDGIYAIHYSDQFTGAEWLGVSLNSAQLTTFVYSCTAGTIVSIATTPASALAAVASVTMRLKVGDVIRPHTGKGTSGANPIGEMFRITKVSG